jgi:hypothetical protein
MLFPMQLICLLARLVEAQLITKFNLHSYGYKNEILYRYELQAVTYHFNLGFSITS